MSYPQTLKYEIKVKTGFHSPNEVEDSCVEDVQSTTFIKLCSSDIILFYCVVKQRSCSIPLNAMNSTLLGRVWDWKPNIFSVAGSLILIILNITLWDQRKNI